MKYVNNLKAFDQQNGTNNYGWRLDRKAEKVLFPYIGSNVWTNAKNIALVNTPQSLHRMDYKTIVRLLDSEVRLSCLDVSNIVMCMQQLSCKDFNNCVPEYLLFLKENDRVMGMLQEFYAGFDEKIDKDLEDEVKKEKSKPKILTINGTN